MVVGNGRFLSPKEKKRRERVIVSLKDFHMTKVTEDHYPIQSNHEEEESETTISWTDGRRIVDLKFLVEQLKSCTSCGSYIQLVDTFDEKRFGFGSVLSTRCACGCVNLIKTSKSHSTGARGPVAFDVNSKIALGMTDAGLGARPLNKLFAMIGVPGMSANGLKTREREVHKPLVNTAKKSCEDAIEKETSQTLLETPLKGLAVKYDMCWQKRGSGRAYDSPSGVGTVIGTQTGKILDFGICTTHCKICLYAEKKKMEPRHHNCPKNWSKSSKAMEACTGARLIEHIENKSEQNVDVLIMDDDAATMSKVRELLGHEVDKWSDINHSKKSLGKAMYNLQNKHKILSTTVIKYFQKCFSYAVAQNKGNETDLKKNLEAIVEHAFGKHNSCGSWCRAGEDDYKFESLPKKQCLTDESLYKDMSLIFKSIANNSKRLAPGASTLYVESTNNIYASKAPKRCCYSMSESLENRVCAAAAQKNLGYSYMTEVFKKAELPPCKILKLSCEKLTKERKRQNSFYQKPIVKKWKRAMKNKQKNKTSCMEKKEGVMYQTNMSVNSIPSDIPVIRYRPETLPVNEKTEVVVFDLETSSLSLDCDILQIAACHLNSNSSFSTYIQPSSRPISSQATTVTGLSSKGGVLFYKGSPVNVSSPEAAYQNFTLWLSQHKPVLLAAHNCKTFDSRRLLYNVSKYSVCAEFRENVSGFLDTLPLFKALLPNLNNYKQETIYTEVCGGAYTAHNAVDDVSSLKGILSKVSPNYETFKQYSFTLESMNKQLKFDSESRENLETLIPLVNKKVMSKRTADVMAKSGLMMQHLTYAFEKSQDKGINKLMKERRKDESPRVTKNDTIIDKVSTFLRGNKL